MKGKLYVGFDGTGLFKIGITQDADKRLRQFRTGNPTFNFLFVFTVDNPAITELELHTKFGDRREKGEWFGLEYWDLKYIYDKFMGEHATHTMDDFKVVWDMIVRQKIGRDFERMDEINNYVSRAQ